MKARKFLSLLFAAVFLVAMVGGRAEGQGGPEVGAAGTEPSAVDAFGTAFTYQGQLIQDGMPANGTCDFRFRLCVTVTCLVVIGPVEKLAVAVTGGLFTVPDLDFGSGAFDGGRRWLEVAVRCPAGSGDYTVVGDRQELTPAPHALYAAAAPWAGLGGVPAGFADGQDNDVVGGLSCAANQVPKRSLAGMWACAADDNTTYSAGTGLALGGTIFSIGGSYRLPQACAGGQVAKWDGSAWTCAGDDSATYTAGAGLALDGTAFSVLYGGGGSANTAARSDHSHDTTYWKLSGNAGTAPGAQFLGTTDNQALELKVNGARALRLEPHASSPNLIGGYSGNSVTAGVYGATIGGGGKDGYANVVNDGYGTVGGGYYNRAGNYGVVNDDEGATVAGGRGNTASAYGATVSGGDNNRASGGDATVGGGANNTANGDDATIAGGGSNTASGVNATVGGGHYNMASGWDSTVGGGSHNLASVNRTTVGGGQENTASAEYGTVAGGYENTASGGYGTVSGGGFNTASGTGATVSGGSSNTASGAHSFATGYRAKANHDGAFVWADSTGADFASSANNEFAVRANGGVRLEVGYGGWRIEPDANSPNVIGGYGSNTVSPGVYGATIGGGGWGYGLLNSVKDNFGTVGGGVYNQAGDNTEQAKNYATVSGGRANKASGWAATVAGGYGNTASGDYSFAAGTDAHAYNIGTFVWGDATGGDVISWGDNQFLARASGGVYFYTDSGLTSGVYVPAGGSAWSSVSDRDRKENFEAVDGRDLLDRLAQAPVTTWNYKSQDPSIRHIGPVAQDFYAAFGVGEDDTHISTIDADGVALAGVQGLYQMVQEQEVQLEAMQAENAALKAEADSLALAVAGLETRVAALEAGAGDAPAPDAGRWGLAGLLATGLAVGVVRARRGGGR